MMNSSESVIVYEHVTYVRLLFVFDNPNVRDPAWRNLLFELLSITKAAERMNN